MIVLHILINYSVTYLGASFSFCGVPKILFRAFSGVFDRRRLLRGLPRSNDGYKTKTNVKKSRR